MDPLAEVRSSDLSCRSVGSAERVGVMQTPFRCGFLAWPAIQDVINYGRAHGLDVDVYVSGKVFKRGWVVARGRESRLRDLGRMFDKVGQELGRQDD